MEHIIQFAVSVEDDKIVKRIEENAEKTIIERLQKEVSSILFSRGYYGMPSNNSSEFVKAYLEEFLKDHKDEIIKSAGEYLSERLMKTKAAKELIEELKNGSI